jgi:hypothetical protein
VTPARVEIHAAVWPWMLATGLQVGPGGPIWWTTGDTDAALVAAGRVAGAAAVGVAVAAAGSVTGAVVMEVALDAARGGRAELASAPPHPEITANATSAEHPTRRGERPGRARQEIDGP